VPGVPAIVPRIIWAVAVLIIIVVLLRALGVFGHDPQIFHGSADAHDQKGPRARR